MLGMRDVKEVPSSLLNEWMETAEHIKKKSLAEDLKGYSEELLTSHSTVQMAQLR